MKTELVGRLVREMSLGQLLDFASGDLSQDAVYTDPDETIHYVFQKSNGRIERNIYSSKVYFKTQKPLVSESYPPCKSARELLFEIFCANPDLQFRGSREQFLASTQSLPLCTETLDEKVKRALERGITPSTAQLDLDILSIESWEPLCIPEKPHPHVRGDGYDLERF